MRKLEIHTLICKRDIEWLKSTIALFKHHSKINFDVVIHEDGSLSDTDSIFLEKSFHSAKVIRRSYADQKISTFLESYPNCHYFRYSDHLTIFKLKLFDPFFFTKSNNILYMDADILFCRKPRFLLKCMENETGFYLRDAWTSYCEPYQTGSQAIHVERLINAGLDYYPTPRHYSLQHIENALSEMFKAGAKEKHHPFLEQSCIAYMISQLKSEGVKFTELPHPDYCVPTFPKFLPNHHCVALHLNSCPDVGHSKTEHYNFEKRKAVFPHKLICYLSIFMRDIVSFCRYPRLHLGAFRRKILKYNYNDNTQ